MPRPSVVTKDETLVTESNGYVLRKRFILYSLGGKRDLKVANEMKAISSLFLKTNFCRVERFCRKLIKKNPTGSQ